MEEYVRIHYGVLMIKEIAAKLGIQPKDVSNKIAEKGWKKQGIREYAVYDGDRHVMSGTIQECANAIGVSTNTIKFYTMDVYTKRKLERGIEDGYWVVDLGFWPKNEQDYYETMQWLEGKINA